MSRYLWTLVVGFIWFALAILIGGVYELSVEYQFGPIIRLPLLIAMIYATWRFIDAFGESRHIWREELEEVDLVMHSFSTRRSSPLV